MSFLYLREIFVKFMMLCVQAGAAARLQGLLRDGEAILESYQVSVSLPITGMRYGSEKGTGRKKKKKLASIKCRRQRDVNFRTFLT